MKLLQPLFLRYRIWAAVQKAKKYEHIASCYNHSVEGDLALHLMMRYKDRANALIQQIK